MEVLPGSLGGVIAPKATDGSTVFVAVVDGSLTLSGQEEKSEGGPGNSEIVALDLATGKVEWKEERDPVLRLPAMVDDRVFATTYDGTVSAFDAKAGTIVSRQTLPAGTNSGVTASGEMLMAPAEWRRRQGRKPRSSPTSSAVASRHPNQGRAFSNNDRYFRLRNGQI